MIEFANHLFSAVCPANWVVRERQDGSGMILANSELGLDRFHTGAVPKPGDRVLVIYLTPSELF